MTTHMNNRRLALYLSDDLSRVDHRLVAEHLETCSECRGTLADLARSHALVVGSFEEPTLDELAAVRSAVISRIRVQRRRAAWWGWAFAASAIVAVLLLVVLARTQWRTPPQSPQPRAVAPSLVKISPEPAAPQRTEIVRAPRRHTAPGIRAVTLVTRADQPDWLKIHTTDPNVVILWQLNEHGKVETQ